MKNVSNDFKKAMEMRQDFYCTAEIVFADKSTRTLGKKDFEISGNSYTESAESNSFSLGMVISKQISLSLVNYDDRWSEYDFQWAKIFLKTKFDLDDGRTETINIGRFTVISPETYGTTIEVIAMDDSYKLDKDYESGLRYPVRISEALRESCSKCDVSLNSVSFENDDYVIQEKPEKLTHRQFIGLCAMIAGGNARFDEFNRLEIITYDFSEFEKLEWLDGGIFDNSNPYAETYETGDDADGGSFKPWNTGYIADGGAFGDRDKVHILYDFKSGLTVDTDDVVITGVKLKGKEDKEYLFGKEGYVLSIENALASGQEEHTAALIGQKIVGLQFRPFSGDHISYPLAEFGDLALVIDRRQNVYRTVLTDVNFVYYGFTSLKCSADSPVRNSSKYYGNEVKAIVEARQLVRQEKTEREKALEKLTEIVENASGLYTTEDAQPDGSVIFYMHDKPTLKESLIVWKMTAEAWGVSTDGGKTYNAGMTVDGDTIVRILTTTGVNADWINTGHLSADRIQGGTLELGGTGNRNGVLKIFDSSGRQIGTWDSNGINATTGTFSGNLNGAKGTFSGSLQAATGTFSGNLNAAGGTFSGSLEAASGTFVTLIQKTENSLYPGRYSFLEIRDNAIVFRGEVDENGNVVSTPEVHTSIGEYRIQTKRAEIGRLEVGSYAEFAGSLKLTGLSSKAGTALTALGLDSKNFACKFSSSSKRYKEDISSLKERDVEGLYDIPVRVFKYREEYLDKEDERYGRLMPGFIAEEMEEILPIAVNHNEDGSPEMWNAQILIPCMMKMIQEQKERIDALEERLGET